MNSKYTRDFPPELLRGTLKDRIEYFRNAKASHRALTAAFDRAMMSIGHLTGPNVVIAAGPTGVGKTTMASTIRRHIMKSYQDEATADRSFVPIISINAVPPNGASFSWKDFYIRLLEHEDEVLIDRKLLIPRQGELFPDDLWQSPLERSVTDALRRSVEEYIKRRRSKVLLIDEAHHLLMVNDPKRLEFQFEGLKSLTIETGVTIVLVGTYRLLELRDQSGQLVRRSDIVHFPRYDLRVEKDAAEFASVLHKFQNQLPLEGASDLMTDVEYFYLKTGGGIGILKDWLMRCLEQAIITKRKTIDADFADQFALSNKSLRTIIEEAMVGEMKLTDISLDSIKTLLQNGIALPGEAPAATPAPRAKGSRRRVGERNPCRDKTGGSHVAP